MSVMRIVVWSAVLVASVVAAFLGGFYLRADEGPPDRPPRITFITAAPDDFYQVVMAGARAAAQQYDATVDFVVPADVHEQSAVISGLNNENTDGVAISPRSPRNQIRMLSRLATKVPVVTYDNDAPESLRHCYIGTDNYLGGGLSAKLVQEALPDGGKVAVFIGDVERNNAKLRRLGFIDELLRRGRSDEGRVDPLDRPMEGNGYTIVGTYLDDHDEERCRENVEQAMNAHEDLDALVGLYGYVAPACLKVVRGLDEQKQIKIVGFDAHQETLQGIEDGLVVGTIVQDPYRYGYESIRLLDQWWEDRYTRPIGSNAPVIVPCKRVGPDNLDEYRDQLAKHLALQLQGDDEAL